MGRPRAGHAWTGFARKGQMIKLIGRWDGTWTTTGVAASWPRCIRCRKPTERSPYDSGMCSTCYFYKFITIEDFWRLHRAGYELAPYNIGRRSMAHMAAFRLDCLHDQDVDWRAYLATQKPPPPRPQDVANLWRPTAVRTGYKGPYPANWYQTAPVGFFVDENGA